MSDRLALVLCAALCFGAVGTTSAAAGELPSDGAAAFSSRPFANLFEPGRQLPSLTQEAAKAPVPPEPRHTGFSALIRTTGSDFVAFPKRKSTWAILGIGAAAALAVHPADDDINDWAVDADGLRKFL